MSRLPQSPASDAPDLRAQIDAAQRIWEHRVEESKLAQKAEARARRDLQKLANKAVRTITKR